MEDDQRSIVSVKVDRATLFRMLSDNGGHTTTVGGAMMQVLLDPANITFRDRVILEMYGIAVSHIVEEE